MTPLLPLLGLPLALAAPTVTFHRDVEPILQKHCQACHRPGEVGPFSLLTYRQAAKRAEGIVAAAQARRMPPWKAASDLQLRHVRQLTAAERATLAAWNASGVSEGDPRDAPRPLEFADDWQLGKPDLVLEVAEEMMLAASGTDLFRVFVLPTALAEDRFVTAVEVRPGNRRVVHHALLFFDKSGTARRLQQANRKRTGKEASDQGPGYTAAMGIGFRPDHDEDAGELGAWAPGQGAWRMPEGSAYRLPRGADVLLQVHYHRTGRVERDRTIVGLYFSPKPVKRVFQGLVLAAPFIHIPAGEPDFRVGGAIELEQDCRLHSLLPHMHFLGKRLRVRLIQPGARPVTLLAIDDWDFWFQETYFLQTPLDLRAGTRLEVTASFDNSERNIHNPSHPPRLVVFGDQNDDEMCSVFLGLTAQRPGRIAARIISTVPAGSK
jgi:hypothetical protein